MAQHANRKISVITICRDSIETIEQCIKSVLSQTYSNLEYIVIDGGSSDGTVEVIKSYSDQIYIWSSARDHGIADAMNQGLQKATGELVIFLHSDDYFSGDGVIASFIEKMDPRYDIYACNILLGHGESWVIKRPRGFGLWMNMKTGVYHQGSVCRRDVFRKIGNFDVTFSIAMDYDFFLRAYRAGLKLQKVDIVLANMRNTGIGSRLDWRHLKTRLDEEKKVHKKNADSLSLGIIYRLYWPIYTLYRRVRSIC